MSGSQGEDRSESKLEGRSGAGRGGGGGAAEGGAEGGVAVIGLLGAPGSGKSHYAAALARCGAAVIDADAIAREVLEDPEVRRQLVQRWGPGVLDEAGRGDRAAVGRRVFDEPAELRALEAIVHPRVNARRRELRAQYQERGEHRAIVEDCPLLLERGLAGGCDLLAWVETPRAVRVARVAKRGWDEAELDRRERQQWPLDRKRAQADHHLPGNADASEVARQARILLERAESIR